MILKYEEDTSHHEQHCEQLIAQTGLTIESVGRGVLHHLLEKLVVISCSSVN